MIGLGYVEVLMVALLSSGVSSTDLASIVSPADYFQSRQIAVSIDRMIDIVVVDPKTPKQQIMQLTALRYLAEQADNLKKAKNYKLNREALEDIAKGKLATDPLGFSQEYAQRVLARLDGAKPPPRKFLPLREGALDWFPAEVKFAVAFDGRHAPAPEIDPFKEIMKIVPKQVKSQLYDQLEKMGNLRIDRIAFGMVDSEKRDEQKLMIRITGKGNHAWVAEMLKAMSRGTLQERQIKDAGGKAITVFQERNRGPHIVLVGNTDLLVVGYQKFDGKHEDVLQEVLAVRAKKRPHAGTGTLKPRLAKVPDKAIALLVGEIPGDLKREFRFAFDSLPSGVTAFIERTPTGMDLQIATVMDNREQADGLVQKIAMLQKKGVAELQKEMQQPRPGGPMIPFQGMIDVLQSLQIQSKDARVQGRVFVPDRLIQQIGQAALAGRAQFDEPLKK